MRKDLASDEFEAVDDMLPEGAMPIGFIRAAVFLDSDGKRTVTADWNEDLESFEFYGLLGTVQEFYNATPEDIDEEEA